MLLSSPAFDPQNANIMYMGVSTCFIYCNYAMFKSNDAGRTWIQWPIKLADGPEISAMVVNPRNSRVLYVGTSPGAEGCCGAGGWWKSVDAGLNWVKLTPNDFPPVLAAPQDPNTVYYSDGAVHKS